MKIVKYTLFIILGIIGLLLIVALFVDGEIQYEKSIEINAPIEKVWENTNSMEDINRWSPWIDRDPGMHQSITGAPGTIGQSHEWASAKDDVGQGMQTITAIQPPNEIQTEIVFLTPYESRAIAYVKLSPIENGTQAIWGFNSVVPYPWRLSNLFMDMGTMLDPDYTKGLERLKSLSESN
ncbi:MAG: SRPBCC family protein [Flavobacteriaceae bacterium]|nr:SRPBCC family protein [Flavobacteriaceae bacterium]